MSFFSEDVMKKLFGDCENSAPVAAEASSGKRAATARRAAVKSPRVKESQAEISKLVWCGDLFLKTS